MITPVAIIMSLLTYVQSVPALASTVSPLNCGNYGKTAHAVKWTTISKAAGYSSLTKTFKAVKVCCAGACCSTQKVITLSGVICDKIVKGKNGALMTPTRANACVLEIECGGAGDKTFVSGNIAGPPGGAPPGPPVFGGAPVPVGL